MSEKQPEALRLADTFEGAAQMMEAASDDYFYKGAAELRRQHTLLEEMAGASRGLLDALPSATTHPAIVTMRAILAKWDGIEMSDYMKEAERLIEEYGNAEWKVGKMSEHSDDAEEIVTRENARAALLAHIQRGAVPKGWQVVPSADQLWNNDEVMALNVELGLTLDQMSRLVRAALRGEVKP